jgi:hypothetical protein
MYSDWLRLASISRELSHIPTEFACVMLHCVLTLHTKQSGWEKELGKEPDAKWCLFKTDVRFALHGTSSHLYL